MKKRREEEAELMADRKCKSFCWQLFRVLRFLRKARHDGDKPRRGGGGLAFRGCQREESGSPSYSSNVGVGR